MSFALILSCFVAGALTLLSPCVLPIVPFVAASSMKEHRYGPFFLGIGLVLSFSVTTFILARSGQFFGLDAQQLRYFSGILLLLSSLLFIFPQALDWISAKVSPFLNKFNNTTKPLGSTSETQQSRTSTSKLFGEFTNGVLLGPIWAPCSGPTLGVVMGLLASQDSHLRALFLLMFFAVGALTPLLLLSYGAQKMVQRVKFFGLGNANFIKKSAGFITLIMALLILTGADKSIESYLVSVMPESWTNLTVSF